MLAEPSPSETATSTTGETSTNTVIERKKLTAAQNIADEATPILTDPSTLTEAEASVPVAKVTNQQTHSHITCSSKVVTLNEPITTETTTGAGQPIQKASKAVNELWNHISLENEQEAKD